MRLNMPQGLGAVKPQTVPSTHRPSKLRLHAVSPLQHTRRSPAINIPSSSMKTKPNARLTRRGLEGIPGRESTWLSTAYEVNVLARRTRSKPSGFSRATEPDQDEKPDENGLPPWIEDFLELPVGSQVTAVLGVVVGLLILRFEGVRILLGVEAAVIGSVVAVERSLVALLLQGGKLAAFIIAIGLLLANVYWFSSRSSRNSD